MAVFFTLDWMSQLQVPLVAVLFWNKWDRIELMEEHLRRSQEEWRRKLKTEWVWHGWDSSATRPLPSSVSGTSYFSSLPHTRLFLGICDCRLLSDSFLKAHSSSAFASICAFEWRFEDGYVLLVTTAYYKDLSIPCVVLNKAWGSPALRKPCPAQID